MPEIASREFMDNLVSLLKAPYAIDSKVEAKMLELIQTWASAFEGQSHLSYTNQVYRQLQTENFRFPPPTKVSATFVDSSAVSCLNIRMHSSLLLTILTSHLIGLIRTSACAAGPPSHSQIGSTIAGTVETLFAELALQSRYLYPISELFKLCVYATVAIPN